MKICCCCCCIATAAGGGGSLVGVVAVVEAELDVAIWINTRGNTGLLVLLLVVVYYVDIDVVIEMRLNLTVLLPYSFSLPSFAFLALLEIFC